MLISPGPNDAELLGREVSNAAIAAALVTGVILAISGLLLAIFYRPTEASGDPLVGNNVVWIDWVRFGHQWSGRVFILALIVLLAVFVMRALAGTTRVNTVMAPSVACILSGAAWWIGQLLPFDTIVFIRATAGDQLMGFRAALGENVRFVVVGGERVEQNDIAIYLATHVVIIPVLLLGMALIGRHLSAGRIDVP